MKRMLYGILLAGLLLPLGSTAATTDKINALSDVQANIARMPFYKDKRLEFFLTSSKVTMQGTLLTAQWPVIDIIRAGVEVESISKVPLKNGMEVIYRLHSGVDDVVKFWKDRPFSEGIITSENSDIDQVRKIAVSKEKVFFRSPTLDLNGVGYTVDLVKRIITVHSEVEIDLRSAGSSAIGSSLIDTSEQPKKPSGEETIHVTRAFSDELTIDVNRNLVTLKGNVRVFDEAGSITAEVLEIELGGKQAAAGKTMPDNTARTVGDIKSVRFQGSVHAVRTLPDEEKAVGEQEARADVATYQVREELLTMTGTSVQQPVLSRGSDFARADRIELRSSKRTAEFFDHCRFELTREEDGKKCTAPTVVTTRHAVYNDAEKKIHLDGDSRLFDPAQHARIQADTADLILSREGASRPETIVASGKVALERLNEGIQEQASAGKMTYQNADGTILMEQAPKLIRGKDSITGKSMLYFMDSQRLQVNGDCHIFIADTGKAADGAMPGGTDGSSLDVVSQDADLNYGGNQLLFQKNVHVNGRGAKLKSDLLDITLANSPGKSDKNPTRAVATGRVHAEDKSGILDTEVLDVRFATNAANKTDVSHIYCSDGVKIQSRPDPNAASDKTLLGQSGTGSTSLTAKRGEIDLFRNIADFYENVKVFDDRATLDCEHLHAVAKKADGVVPDLDSYQANDEFPRRLAIGSDRELESITAFDNVEITRVLPNAPKQFAKGDRAHYAVAARTLELTAKPPKKPVAVTTQGGMIGDKVIIDLDTQDVMAENGDVLTHMAE